MSKTSITEAFISAGLAACIILPGSIAATHYAENHVEPEIKISVPTEIMESLEHGNGDIHKLYEIFTSEVNQILSGDTAVEITKNGEIKIVQHTENIQKTPILEGPN